MDHNTFHLDKPFLVFATQNPIEQEGTYRLPEAQVDRFMFKLLIDYPSIKEERQIITSSLDINAVHAILTKEEIFQAQQCVNTIYIDDKVIEYIVNIVFATRMPSLFKLDEIAPFIKYGVSPRATLALYHACKAYAFLKNRHFVTPDDVKAVCPAVLRHRIPLTYQAEAEDIKADQLIQKILNRVPVP